MKSPFPYFGGKSRIASEVWRRFGNVPNFVEPFLGSAAVLLGRPDSHQWQERIETANDLDGLLSNFWRATQHDPEAVTHWADWPINENDLHARHAWLVTQRESLQARLEGDPDYYDAKAAGWWLWGICIWIGSGWCSGKGPWHVVDGELVQGIGQDGDGAWRQRTHLSDAGQGINRKLTHIGDAGLCATWTEHLRHMMCDLRDRLRRVRVECGDWSRICGPSPTEKLGLTGVFLDPPYSRGAGRDAAIYCIDDLDVAVAAREWAIERGDNPLYRIALCGYDGEYEMPKGWTEWQWKARGGYGNQGNGRARANSHRERVWFSRYCLDPAATEQ